MNGDLTRVVDALVSRRSSNLYSCSASQQRSPQSAYTCTALFSTCQAAVGPYLLDCIKQYSPADAAATTNTWRSINLPCERLH